MKKMCEKSALGIGGLAMVLATLLTGCSGTGPTSGMGVSSGFGSAKEQWTVVVKRLGPEQRKFTDVVYNSLLHVRGLDHSKVKKLRIGEQTMVIYGEYSGPDDPQAQRDMRFIKSLAVEDQGYPFLDAHLEPMPEPDPPVPAGWLLVRANGCWTLQIAQFHGTGRKMAAVEMVQQLRQENIPAYVYHGPVKSWVTIGDYPENAVGQPGKQRISQRLKVMDPELRKWKRTYPYLLVNSDYAKFKTSHKVPTLQGTDKEVKKEVRLESQIVKIPRSGELLW